LTVSLKVKEFDTQMSQVDSLWFNLKLNSSSKRIIIIFVSPNSTKEQLES